MLFQAHVSTCSFLNFVSEQPYMMYLELIVQLPSDLEEPGHDEMGSPHSGVTEAK